MSAYPTNWTDAAIATLKKLHAKGIPYSAVAAALNAKHGTKFTRNAAIGKANRIGLDRPRPTTPKAAKPKADPPRATRKAAAFTAQPFHIEPDQPGMIKLLDLRPCHCRWPIGDVKADDFGFCGARPLNGKPYCSPHQARATGLTQPRQLRAA